MSNTSIQLKKSGATGNTPTGLAFGEVAINYADGKLYYKNALGGTSYISNQFSFDTINANNSLILATGVSDTLSFVAGNNITISTNTTTKTITINSTSSGATDQFARDVANSGYAQANTATNNAAGASLYANGAFAQANAAFNKANTYPGNPNQVLYKNSSNVLTSSSGLIYDGVSIKVNGNLESTFQSGDEGGEIFLNKSVTNTTLSSGVSIDVYQNRLRIFETGGSNRGVYIDMANGAASGIGTNLLSPPGGAVTSVAGATGTVSNTQLIAGIQTVSSSYGITFDFVATANNGQGTNFKVGDDAWIGDYNTADSLKIKGQQNAANGYVSFGSNTSQLGAAGSGQLTYGGNIVWHAGNDGAGSGLDADLLDGLDSSAFARVSAESYANSAYTQANTATTNAATADSKAVTAGSYANSSFGVANSAALYANAAFIQANAAFIKANSIPSSANTANSANIAGVAVNARITNVTTGTYFPIVTDTTITGSDTFHYSSGDFLMYAANNTFRATGNVWAGEFIAVGTNIPVVNSTGHWVGQTVNGIDSFARTTANAALPTAGGTVTGNLTLSTTATMIIQNTRPTTSNSTGALIVRGGVGIAGNLFVGGIFTVDGDFQVGNTTSTGNVFNSGFVTFSQPTQFTSNATTTSNTTGAIIATGGIATRGNLFSGAIRITGPSSNGLTFADGTVQYTANASSSSIVNGSSNIVIPTANGSIIANVGGNTIFTITANGFSTSGANGDISGANNIFSNFINVTSASIVSGVNVVPFIQSAFNRANNSLNANTGGRVTGNTVISNVDMANAIYSNVSFSVATQEDAPSAMSISADGKKMFVMGTTGDDVNEYDLTTPWLVSSATFVRVFSVASQENFPTGLFFRPDGLKFYVVGQTNDTVYQYALTTPWDLSTASYESKSFSVTSQENNPTGIFFRPNGLSMYVTGSSTDSVHQYTLSTAWDVSTATFLQSFSVASEETVPQDLSFANDGSRMFVMGNIGDDVNIYNLSTSWNVSTAVFSTTFSVAAQDDAPIGMFIEVDGSRFYMLGSSNDTVYQYRLPMATIEFTGNTFINGDINILQNLNVDGSATFRNEIISNNVISSNIYVSGYNVFTYITNAYIQANAAFAAANAGGAGTDQFARNTANAAFIQANAAFAVANTGGGGGGPGTDNVARQTANAAFIQANAAFDKANVGGGGTDLLVYTNLFTANGNTTTFGLSTIPQNKDYTIVNINGVVQLKNTYSLSGNTLVLSEVVPVNTTIEITVFGGGSVSEYFNRSYTGDNTTTTFAVTGGVTSNSIIVTENGIIQQPGVDYYVSGSNVIFTTAPSSTISIGIRELSRGVSNGSSTFVTQNKTVIDSNVTIGAGYSGVSVGPLTIANNVVINIAAGQKWVIL